MEPGQLVGHPAYLSPGAFSHFFSVQCPASLPSAIPAFISCFFLWAPPCSLLCFLGKSLNLGVSFLICKRGAYYPPKEIVLYKVLSILVAQSRCLINGCYYSSNEHCVCSPNVSIRILCSLFLPCVLDGSGEETLGLCGVHLCFCPDWSFLHSFN